MKDTHCQRGHEFTPENTYMAPNSGRRKCRKCNDDRKKRWRQKRLDLTCSRCGASHTKAQATLEHKRRRAFPHDWCRKCIYEAKAGRREPVTVCCSGCNEERTVAAKAYRDRVKSPKSEYPTDWCRSCVLRATNHKRRLALVPDLDDWRTPTESIAARTYWLAFFSADEINALAGVLQGWDVLDTGGYAYQRVAA